MTTNLENALINAVDANPKGVHVVTAIPASDEAEYQRAVFSTYALASAWIKSAMGKYSRFEIEPMVVDEEISDDSGECRGGTADV